MGDQTEPVDEGQHWRLMRSPGLQVAFLGSAALPPLQLRLCQALGARLATHPHVAVATSGFTGNAARGQHSFTITVARAFAAQLPAADVHRRVTTFMVSMVDSPKAPNLMSIGRTANVRSRNPMNRQAQIVAKSDVLCVGGGSVGSMEFARLALQIEKPMLPLPFMGGTSRELWFKFRDEIRTDFAMADEQVARWSDTTLEQLNDAELDVLAAEIASTLLRSTRGTCLVCMPFAPRFLPLYAQVIAPAIEAAHLHAVRMDHTPWVGDILEGLRQEIEAARTLVAVLDERNPNVMYEVGFAHALRKPVVLMHSSAATPEASADLPFDVRTHRAVRYPEDLAPGGASRARQELQALLRCLSQGL